MSGLNVVGFCGRAGQSRYRDVFISSRLCIDLAFSAVYLEGVSETGDVGNEVFLKLSLAALEFIAKEFLRARLSSGSGVEVKLVAFGAEEKKKNRKHN
jgi:hypothetical protein